MDDDKRDVIIKFRVNPAENELIEKKFRLSSCSSRSRFIRKMIVEGMILHFDSDKEKNLLVSVNRIAANINQIARRVNATGSIYEDDVKEIQKGVEEIRQQLKYFQSLLQRLKP